MIAAWWQAREPRERRVLATGAVVLALLLGWALVWHPLAQSRAALRTRVAAQRADLAAMQDDAARATALKKFGVRAKVERQGRSLLALADSSARGSALGDAFKRAEPLGPKSVRVTFENASFDALADWLDGLARDFGVRATDLSADRAGGSGRVNARVTLEEP